MTKIRLLAGVADGRDRFWYTSKAPEWREDYRVLSFVANPHASEPKYRDVTIVLGDSDTVLIETEVPDA